MVAFNSTISFLLTSWSYLYGSAPPAPIVQTTYGQLEGAQSGESRAGRSFYEFFGVPYAKPPVGQLRFAPPQVPDTWEGVRLAKSTPYECIQYHIGRRVTGDEDCLYLNVFAHKPRILGTTAAGKEPLKSEEPEAAIALAPVMVFLHGGMFMFGGARVYGARYIMDHDVVLVVVQYRLGALGFLNTGEGHSDGGAAVASAARGNMALKDQTMALRWVQHNIAAFGGDPGRVTLVGQSAGAVCAHMHTLSPMSRGLFQQVILQSGNALAPWGLKTRPAEQAQRFASRLGCPTNSSEAMVTCLWGLDATELVRGHDDFPHQLYEQLVIFGPTIESGGNGTDTFLDDAPLNLLRAGRAMDVPMLQGVNAAEGLLFAAKIINNETVRTTLASNWSAYAPKFLGLDDHPQRVEVVERVREYYLSKGKDGNETEGSLSRENLMNMTNMLSDRNFFQPVRWLAEWNLERQNMLLISASATAPAQPAPMYLYFYTYKGELSPGNFVVHLSHKLPQLLDIVVSIGGQWVSSAVFGTEPEHFGAGHADEIFMLFKVPILRQHELGTKDYAMSKAIVKTWVDFVSGGAPKAGEACWEPVGKFCGEDSDAMHAGLEFMKLDNDSHVIQEPFEDRIRFWESLGLNEKI